MSHTTNKILAPVEMPADIAAILNISGTSLEQACKCTAINKWAKYKPVVKNVIGVLTDAQRQSANYGISKIPTWSNINKMATFWLLEDRSSSTNYPDCGLATEYWDYTHPYGTSAAPYRLSDFAKNSNLGYYHEAQAPLSPIRDTNLQITADGQLNMTWVNGDQDDMTIKYTDLMYDGGGQISLSGFYFTAILARVGATTTKYVMTDDDQSAESAITQGVYCRPWFQDEAAVDAFLGNSNSAQFYCMIFLCNQQIYDTFSITSGGTTTTYRKFQTNLGSVTADNFVALLDRQTVKITKIVAKFNIDEVLAWKNSSQSNQYIYYSIIITNNDPNVKRYYKITVEVKDNNDTVLATKLYNTVNDYVNAGSQKTITDDINAGQYYSGATKLTVTTEVNPTRDNAKITGTDTMTVNIALSPPV